jgi:hypothetical protein
MAVTITPTSLPDGVVNAEYTTTTLAGAGGVSPYTFAVTTGATPAGLSLSSSGVLSGTPTAAGSTDFTVTATDSTPDTHLTGTEAYTLVVGAADVVLLVQCPSFMCAKVPPVEMRFIEGDLYLCPRCEQQSTVTNGVATLAHGFHD